MEQELKILVMGTLLHDIGKFAQRAKRPYSKEMEGEYLTTYKGKPGHWHTVYTDYFIENDLPLPEKLNDLRSHISRISSVHHRPDENKLSEMSVSIADRLSSGLERIKDEEPESQTGFRESRLVSVFDEIEILNHRFEPPGNAFYDLVPLETGSEGIFPRTGKPAGPPEDYIALFEQFLTELKKLNNKLEFNFYLDGLISVLEKYTWCIPSSAYKTLPDISLFDHAVCTAGISQALYLYHQEKNTLPTWNDDESKFILLAGDLSGIQEYIFGISRNSGKGVSKIFRARSFYLQVLSRSILLEIQNRLNLFPVCRLMDSGGKFIVLVPNLNDVRTRLDNLEDEVQMWFRSKFKGLLNMILSWSTELRHEDFLLKNFQAKIDEVNQSLEESKYGKLKKTFSAKGPLIDENYDENEGGNCTLCDKNIADDESSEVYEKKEGLSISICKDCLEQIVYIGTRLPNTEYLAYGPGEKISLFGDMRLSLLEKAPSELSKVTHVETLSDSTNFCRVRLARYLPRLTKEELVDERWHKLFQTDEDQYLDAGQPKTFSLIAKKSKKSVGDKLVGRELLGFLKADVDNLGFVFSLGLGDRLSAARFTSISRMMNHFFSEYLIELVKKDFPDIYVVFAGGDDMLLVGPWWQSISFAIMLRKKLSQFCAGNPDITMSSALLMAAPRLPMRKAVEMVEDNLQKAKKYVAEDRLKDSVFILGETLSWHELEKLIALGEKFNKAIEEKNRTNFSTAFLYRLIEYHKMYRKFIYDDQIRQGRYLSLAHYDIGRNIKSRKNENQDELDMLYKIFNVGIKERPELDKLHVPLFYAINLNRETR
jgi:CRISPR-associated protein Csm1